MGITLTAEDAAVFWQSEASYAVTPQQKRRLAEAKDVYKSHPIKF
ncbi:MAG: hypothetical protein NTU95_09055 [Methanothrix sp.]|nr:hypothetical protein [Methanothrix sp.]